MYERSIRVVASDTARLDIVGEIRVEFSFDSRDNLVRFSKTGRVIQLCGK